MKSRRHRAITWAEQGRKRKTKEVQFSLMEQKIKKIYTSIFRFVNKAFQGLADYLVKHRDVLEKLSEDKQND